jgi:MoaA/NifB/PqqE/SkfB family radical SAM enzyme
MCDDLITGCAGSSYTRIDKVKHMNKYINLERLEFIITKKCSGNCKHCSVIRSNLEPKNSFENFEKVTLAMKYLLDNFSIKSIMTYGGEPLLFSEITCRIHEIGKKYGVEKRELITNGYFSKNENTIRDGVKKIIESGINEIMLSIDAFHQEKIPIKYVEVFIKNIIALKFENIKIHPSWVVSKEVDNVYNNRTKELIKYISKYGIKTSNGNNIIPSGLAKKNLKKYYVKEKIDLNMRCGGVKFTNSPLNVKSMRMLPNGNINICRGLIIGNIYNKGIEDIVNGYNPYENNIMSVLLDGGIIRLHQFAEENGRKINIDKYYNSCDLCTDCIKAINIIG